MNKQELAKLIWDSAQNMRGSIEAAKYKDYIFGFMFYKYLSEKEEKYLLDQGMPKDELKQLTESDTATVTDVQDHIGYFIEYKNLFSNWYNIGLDFSIDDVRVGLSAFNRNINTRNKNMYKVYSGIFDTMQANLKDLGSTDAEQSKVARELVKTINKIPMAGKEDYDVLGYVYEYLLSNFAAGAGKKAGEFYSPHSIAMIISEIIANHHKDKDEISVYDMAAGSSSLLITVGKAVSKHMNNPNGVKYYAQELITDTYNLARMNLIMKDVIPDNIIIRNGNTLSDDWPFFEDSDKENTYNPVWVDAVAANPPYSAHYDQSICDGDPRFDYGVAPASKADYAFLQHGLYHLNENGIMGIVLPHGVLFRGGEEETIRKNLIEHHHIKAIIGLPAGIFYGTGIPTIIMVLCKKREDSSILIVDASKGFVKEGKQNALRAKDIKKITDTVNNRKEIPGYSRIVTLEEIQENGYNLNIPRYVDSSEKPESYDIYATMFGGIPDKEINELADYWAVFPTLKEDLFEGEDYKKIKHSNIKEFINTHANITDFIKSYKNHMDGLDGYLKSELIDNAEDLHINGEEVILTEEIFNRFENLPLVDRYEAYQILSDNWSTISGDLELIQTEGIDAVKTVDPNMITKKKSGKDIEVQDGWKGHILPFDLVQKTMLKEQLNGLNEKENQLTEINTLYEELLDSLTEEQKDKVFINEDNTAFVWAEVKKALKAKEEEQEVLNVLEKAFAANAKEKSLKKEVKEETEALHLLTKETIEGLNKSQIEDLLFNKWIDPIVKGIEAIPQALINSFISQIELLSKKYETTLKDVENDIRTTKKELAMSLNDLTGSEHDLKGIQELKSLLGGSDE